MPNAHGVFDWRDDPKSCIAHTTPGYLPLLSETLIDVMADGQLIKGCGAMPQGPPFESITKISKFSVSNRLAII